MYTIDPIRFNWYAQTSEKFTKPTDNVPLDQIWSAYDRLKLAVTSIFVIIYADVFIESWRKFQLYNSFTSCT